MAAPLIRCLLILSALTIELFLGHAPQYGARGGTRRRILGVVHLVVKSDHLPAPDLHGTGIAAVPVRRVIGEHDTFRLVPGSAVGADHGVGAARRVALAVDHQDTAVFQLYQVGGVLVVGGDLDRFAPGTCLFGVFGDGQVAVI